MVLFLQFLLVIGILNNFLVGMFWFCILMQVVWKLKLEYLPNIVRYLDGLWILCGIYVNSQFRTYLSVLHNLYWYYINFFF